jgi:hypothetical protein
MTKKIARIWRGSPRQANDGRLISAGRTGGGHAVLTSDDGDIAGVNPELILVHV